MSLEFSYTPELLVAASPDLLQRGCVYILNLGFMETESGARWPKVQGAVWEHLDNLMRQKLSSTDFYTQLDGMNALISLPALTAIEAQMCCLRIAHDLHVLMFGRGGSHQHGLLRATAMPDGRIGSVAVNAPTPEELMAHATVGSASGEARVDERGRGILSHESRNIQFQHLFVPVWDAQKEAVTTYRSVSVIESDLSDPADQDARQKLELAITLSRIRHTTRILELSLAAGERFLAWIPMSYETLSSPVRRMEIIAVCRGLSRDIRPYLIFEICDLPHGVPPSRLSDLSASLHPFCRSIMAQLPMRTINYTACVGVGLNAIGLSLLPGQSDKEIRSEIFKLGAAASRHHIHSFVLNIPTEDLLKAARRYGINLLSSPLIGHPVELPRAVKRLSVAEVHRALTAA